MRRVATALLSFEPPRAPQVATPAPVSSLQRFTLEFARCEGSFGTYFSPGPGRVAELDLERAGDAGLLRMEGAPGNSGALHPDQLLRVRDSIDGSEELGWTRRVLLKGRLEGGDEETTLELLVQHEVEGWKQGERGRVEQHGNVTNVTLRVHTLRADDTAREDALARGYHDRDADVRVPAARD